MPYFVLFVVLVAGTEPQMKPSAPAAQPGAAEVRRLVEQLGDDSFAVREQATRALRALGERALPMLRKAAKGTDPEVRWRASKAVRTIEEEARRRQIEAIKNSKLSLREQGRRLKAFITKGMTNQQVAEILGPHTRAFGFKGTVDMTYTDYKLKVVYVEGTRDLVFRVLEVKLMSPK